MSTETASLVESPADLPRRTWRQWWRELPGYYRIAGRTAFALAAIHLAIAAWLLPGYFESGKVTKLRRHGATVVYAWERRPRKNFGNPHLQRWVSALNTGLYGQSPRQVVDISLRDAFTDNRLLEHIGENFPNLEWLRINDPNSRVTVDGIKALRGCRKLRGLMIWGHVVDEDFLQAIASLDIVEHLYLMESTVTARDLSAIQSLTNLRGLNLNGSDVTDLQIAPIVKCAGLQALEVSGSRITNESLAVFQRLPSLQYVRLEYTDVTQPAIDQWRSTMKAGLPKIYTDRELPGGHIVFRWSDGKLSAPIQTPQIGITLHIHGPTPEAENSEAPPDEAASFVMTPAVVPISSQASRLADGQYRLIAAHGEIKSEPAIITVQGGKTPDGRIELRMPMERPTLWMP